MFDSFHIVELQRKVQNIRDSNDPNKIKARIAAAAIEKQKKK